MLFLKSVLVAGMLACLATGPVYAGCTSPTANENVMIYNSDNHILQFCNGTTWLALARSSGGGGGGCSSPTGREGVFIYNSAYHAFQTCTGTNWVRWGGGAIWGTVPTAANGYFVMSKTKYTGNLGGSFAAANALCLTELTTNTGWKGYATANANGQLISAKVKAFICGNVSSGVCNQLTASTTYFFANANDSSIGGSSFTTDASHNGPGDSADWGGASYFGGDYKYWSDMGNSSATLWDSSGPWSASAACGTTNYWDTGTNAKNGAPGYTSMAGQARWYTPSGDQIVTCDTLEHLICFVNP
jgi:hypothetical protein